MPSESDTKTGEILRGLSPDQTAHIMGWLSDKVNEAVRAVIPTQIDSLFEKMGYTEEIAGMSHLIAARTGDSQEGVLRKALTLYGVAVDAREKGNRLAILSPEDEIVREIVGFDPDEVIAEPASRRG